MIGDQLLSGVTYWAVVALWFDRLGWWAVVVGGVLFVGAGLVNWWTAGAPWFGKTDAN